MRLRTTLVGVLLVVAVVLSGALYFGFALHKDDIVAQERQQVETTASVVATDVESQLSTRTELVELWSRNEDVIDESNSSRRRALAAFVDGTPFQGGSIIRPNGQMVAFRSESLSLDQERAILRRNYGSRPYVQAALDGQTYVSEPFEANSGTRIVAVSTPMYRNGTVVGVLTGSIHLDNGSLFANAASLGRSSHRVAIASENSELFSGGSQLEGDDSLTATAVVDDVNWTVTAAQSRSDFAGQIQDTTLLQLGAVALTLVLIGGVGVWISRSTIRQLDDLVDGMEELESGSYGRQLELDTTDEWRRISDSFNDLSETLQHRESQLQVLNRVLRHNLRNDMNVVTAHAESALANEATSPDVTADLEKIQATADRLINTSEHARALYEDLLSQGIKEPEPVDVTDIVDQQIETLQAEFPESTIQAEFPPEALALDTTVLPIVIEELLHNALVHNDRPETDRTVAVTVERQSESRLGDGGEIRVVITDNGPGIPMVEEALLTDELEETPVEHGSGLGVWLVNWLIEKLDGTVEAHTGIERGTTVTVRVPAALENGQK